MYCINLCITAKAAGPGLVSVRGLSQLEVCELGSLDCVLYYTRHKISNLMYTPAHGLHNSRTRGPPSSPWISHVLSYMYHKVPYLNLRYTTRGSQRHPLSHMRHSHAVLKTHCNRAVRNCYTRHRRLSMYRSSRLAGASSHDKFSSREADNAMLYDYGMKIVGGKRYKDGAAFFQIEAKIDCNREA